MALGLETVAEDLRAVYNTGKTKTYEWRVSQLKALVKIATHHEKEIVEALRSDLNKPEHEAFIMEVGVESVDSLLFCWNWECPYVRVS